MRELHENVHDFCIVFPVKIFSYERVETLPGNPRCFRDIARIGADCG
jgi:hypothetical protein